MTPLEQLLSIADEETLILVRAMIGKKQLALLIAKAVLQNTTVKLSPTEASNVLEMSLSTVANQIANIGFRTPRQETPLG